MFGERREARGKRQRKEGGEIGKRKEEIGEGEYGIGKEVVREIGDREEGPPLWGFFLPFLS
jgi:hypothetical protein